jgi:acetyl esterase/lipase
MRKLCTTWQAWFRCLNLGLACAIACIATSAAAADAAKPSGGGLQPTAADFAYGSDSKSQCFDFWQAKSDTPTPVVVMIHGGGWINGDKSGFRGGDAKPYLDAGISVASINYRLIAEAMDQHIEPPVKACLYDAARAVQTIRSKAKEWNLDPERVGATGSSAGSCMCLWLALHDDLAQPDSSDPVAKQSTHFQCVAAYRAQTTLDPVEYRSWISNADYGAHAFGYLSPHRTSIQSFELLLKEREKNLPWIMEYSPIKLATKNAPPIFLDYPNQKTPPVVGQPDPAPAHSALSGLKLAERLQEFGTEIVVQYPGHEDQKYGSIKNFLIAKLTPH